MTQQNLPTSDNQASDSRHTGRSWIKKFGDACRGVKIAVRAESSFFVHLLTTAVVVLAGVVLGISAILWCVVVLCIAVVLAAEMFNTALERIARTITQETNSEIRDALDMASGAVLLAAVGAAVVGVLVFGSDLLNLFAG